MFIRRHWWAVLYSAFLIAFTLYLAMDTFVLSRVYTVVTETDSGTGSAAESTASADTERENESSSDTGAVVSETSYSDENIQITITEYGNMTLPFMLRILYYPRLSIFKPHLRKTLMGAM